MARQLRLEFPGALYHLTARGNAREAIYRGDADRERFLALLGQEIEQQGGHCYAYCLMDNHYYLLIETPEPNLSRGMTEVLHLCIPEHAALQLQLSRKQPREVLTADGKSHMVPYASPANISLLGRKCVTGALVFGNQVLPGAIPMEDMDFVIQPSRQKMTVNPMRPNIPISSAK